MHHPHMLFTRENYWNRGAPRTVEPLTRDGWRQDSLNYVAPKSDTFFPEDSPKEG